MQHLTPITLFDYMTALAHATGRQPGPASDDPLPGGCERCHATITTLAALADHLEDATRQAITGLREFGYSWADIAMRLGVTRQGAQQRWGTTADGNPPDGNRP